jgi:hypothetical protein
MNDWTYDMVVVRGRLAGLDSGLDPAPSPRAEVVEDDNQVGAPPQPSTTGSD